MPKIEDGSNGSFLIDDVPYSKGQYEVVVNADKSSVGIRAVSSGGDPGVFLVNFQAPGDYTDNTDTPLASVAALLTYLQNFFFDVGTGLGAIPFAIRSTDSQTAVFTSLAARDTYYTTTAPGDIAAGTALAEGREAVGIGPTDGSPVGVTAAFIRNDANDDWIAIATNFIGPPGPASTTPGPQGPAGDLFPSVAITANTTINVANLSTYQNSNIINTSPGLGQVTITLDTIANFIPAAPSEGLIFRFVNESPGSTMVISPGTNNFFAQIAGSVTLNQGQALWIKLPQSGTRWNVFTESSGASAGTVPPTVPTALPAGNMALVGSWNPTAGEFPLGASQGSVYGITANGTVDGIAFFNGDFLIAEVDSPSTTTFAGNWGVIPGKGSVHSLFGRQGVLDDAFMIANLDRLGYVRNSGIVNPSFHEFSITTIPTRVDLNTDLNVTQTISFSVTNHGDIASATVQADFATPDTFVDVGTIVVPTIDGTQTQDVAFTLITTNAQKTISFRIRSVDNQQNVHISNEYDVEVRNLVTQEQTHFGTILSTQDETNIVFGTNDIEARTQADGNWTVSGIPDDSNLYRVYFAVPADQPVLTGITQSGFPLYSSTATSGNQFTLINNVSIDGNSYNVLLMNVDAAVNNTYNGSILTTS